MSLEITFGAVVYRARNKLELTQLQLAEAVGVTERAIQYYEKGEFLPKSEVMLKLLIFLKIDPNIVKEEVTINEPLPRSKRRRAVR